MDDMSDIENQFNSFIGDFEKNLGKIEVDLALRVLYLERRIDQGKPKVELYVCYNDGVDIEKKKNQIAQSPKGLHHFLMKRLMNRIKRQKIN